MQKKDENLKTDKTREADDAVSKPKHSRLKKLIVWGAWTSVFGLVVGSIVIVWALIHFRKDLPDYRQLASYEPSVVTRIHAGDGSMLTEFAKERRIFVPINAVPDRQIQAVISAEDKNFYSHIGIDFLGFAKAMVNNVANVAKGRWLVGASTITQQVARNFLLTLDRKLDRKIKEAILSLRIERAYSKDRILELYLNQIYFGNRSYGIASAALNYFNKSLDELTLGEMAYLAALPKGPANYHPVRNKDKAIGRRNWVLLRMHVNGYLTEEEYEAGITEDLVMQKRSGDARFKADFYEEAVRRQLKNMYGDKALYEGGLSVRTSLEPKLQQYAEEALRRGLIDYDRRHGWRGPLRRLSLEDDWVSQLKNVRKPLGIPSWKHGIVIEVRSEGAIIGLKDGAYGFVALSELKWARAWLEKERLGRKITDPAEVLQMGDVIAVEPIAVKKTMLVPGYLDIDGREHDTFARYGLRQIPAIEGGG